MVIDKNYVMKILDEVKDPEVPVLSIKEIGILRDVEFVDNEIVIKITPTYSGCPATDPIQASIKEVLTDNGIENFRIEKIIYPAWTTDWLTEEAKCKLEDYGIAPPQLNHKSEEYLLTMKIRCPFCKSENTKITSEFGSTACKSLHYCEECMQPFEHFKCF